MKSEELEIIHSIIAESIPAKDIDALKELMKTQSGFEVFLNKLIEVMLEKDNTQTLLQFLQLNNFSTQYLILKNKTNNLIEDLSELHSKGYSSENIAFLIETNNSIFNEHLRFLKETQNAFVIQQRTELKKKIKNFDKVDEFELTDAQIKAAITIAERIRLKEDLDNTANNVQPQAKIISFNFKVALKYAAIFVLIVGPTIFLIKRINKNSSDTPHDLAIKKEIVKKDSALNDIDTRLFDGVYDSITKQYKFASGNKNFYSNFPVDTNYNGTVTILEKPSFGFASKNDQKLKITVLDVTGQITVLETELKKIRSKKQNAYYAALAAYISETIDSISYIKNTYTYNKKDKTVTIYRSFANQKDKKSQKIKGVTLDNGTVKTLFVKLEGKYLQIKETKKNLKLIEETNEDVLDSIKLIENTK